MKSKLRERRNFTNKTEKFKNYWQPLIITYTITVILIVATCVVVHQCFYHDVSQYPFYAVSLENYIVYLLAKVSESLIPTTITFSLLLILTTTESNDETKTFLIVFIVLLAAFGIIQPTIRNLSGFWTMLILIYATIILVIFETGNLFKCTSAMQCNNHKSEISDGKLSG